MPLAPVIGASLISGGLSAIGGIFGRGSQNRANMRLAKYQHKLNMDAWREQNEYNTPAQQMQRYRDAGLNPHMVAGSGTSGNATAPPQYQAPQVDKSIPTDFLDTALGTYMSLKSHQTNNKLLEEQIKSSEADTALKEIEVATASNEYNERFNHTVDEFVNGEKVGSRPALSKYSQEYRGRHLDNKLKEIAHRVKTDEHTEHFSQENIRQREKEAELKLKKLGQEVNFNHYRNKLAKLGLTFSSSEWGALISQIIDFAEQKFGNYAKKKK